MERNAAGWRGYGTGGHGELASGRGTERPQVADSGGRGGCCHCLCCPGLLCRPCGSADQGCSAAPAAACIWRPAVRGGQSDGGGQVQRWSRGVRWRWGGYKASIPAANSVPSCNSSPLIQSPPPPNSLPPTPTRILPPPWNPASILPSCRPYIPYPTSSPLISPWLSRLCWPRSRLPSSPLRRPWRRPLTWNLPPSAHPPWATAATRTPAASAATWCASTASVPPGTCPLGKVRGPHRLLQ